MIDRTAILQRAVLRRISRAGDMPIRIRTATLMRLLRACGLAWEYRGDDTHREVDAMALEALCVIGGGKVWA